MRFKAKMILEKFAGKDNHPVASVTGGFAKPMLEEDRKQMVADMQEILDFDLFTMEFAKTQVSPPCLTMVQTLGVISTGFLGTVDENGALNLCDGKLRLMKPDTWCSANDCRLPMVLFRPIRRILNVFGK
jgi:F420-non-reducing hydrogenase large subunit